MVYRPIWICLPPVVAPKLAFVDSGLFLFRMAVRTYSVLSPGHSGPRLETILSETGQSVAKGGIAEKR